MMMVVVLHFFFKHKMKSENSTRGASKSAFSLFSLLVATTERTATVLLLVCFLRISPLTISIQLLLLVGSVLMV